MSNQNRCENCDSLTKLLEDLAQETRDSGNRSIVVAKAEYSRDKGLCKGKLSFIFLLLVLGVV